MGSISSRFSGKKEPAFIALNAAFIIRQDSSQRQLQLVLFRLVFPSHLSLLLPQCSLNFIRLLRVVITPPVTTLLRGENDSKQSDEIQARGDLNFPTLFKPEFGFLIPCFRHS